MALTAVISDVHANSYALRAVLADARARGASRTYCLGDLVGYNAHPHDALAILRHAAIAAVKGNHDMMACGELPIDGCGPNARIALHWTREVLSPEELTYLRSLPLLRCIDGDIVLLHSRIDSATAYLSKDADYLAERETILARQPQAWICFTGHTHVARIVEITPQRRLRRLSGTSATLDPDCFYFVNPGSVGHPRGGDYRACYALLDRSNRHVRLLRVHYDKAKMLAANRRAGLGTDLGPSVLAHRFGELTQRLKRTGKQWLAAF